jgi:hypothetical protein
VKTRPAFIRRPSPQKQIALEHFSWMNINIAQAGPESDQCPAALYQGTTSVVPKTPQNECGLYRLRKNSIKAPFTAPF